MCECDGPATAATWSRRTVIAAGVAGALTSIVANATVDASAPQRNGATSRPGRSRRTTPIPAPVPVAAGLDIHPRDAWGADLPPRSVRPETPRFLLVHHTASSNSYRDAREVIRGTYRFHTSAAKGWPDVCYQFFIGRDGDVWEGRAGALDGPVEADATGGSQGWAQLVCLLGDFSNATPTAAAIDSLVRLLEWIARRDGIDVTGDAVTTFVSRGSQRWRAGTTVTTPTISAHRDMSFTACPGERLFTMLPEIRRRVADLHRTYTDPPAPASHPNGLVPARRLGRVTEP